MAKKTKFGKITVQVEGKDVCITDLPKSQYEDFLELMHGLRSYYIAVVDK